MKTPRFTNKTSVTTSNLFLGWQNAPFNCWFLNHSQIVFRLYCSNFNIRIWGTETETVIIGKLRPIIQNAGEIKSIKHVESWQQTKNARQHDREILVAANQKLLWSQFFPNRRMIVFLIFVIISICIITWISGFLVPRLLPIKTKLLWYYEPTNYWSWILL